MRKHKNNKRNVYITSCLIIIFIVVGAFSGCANSSDVNTSEPHSSQKIVQESEPNLPDVQEEDEFEFLKLMRDTSSDKIKAAIKSQAQEDWGSDYDMVKYEYDKQLEAYEKIMYIVNHSGLAGTIDEILMEDALNKWGLDFDMVMYEYDKQLEAWQELQND
jgi:hypothetical protein